MRGSLRRNDFFGMRASVLTKGTYRTYKTNRTMRAIRIIILAAVMLLAERGTPWRGWDGLTLKSVYQG